jgi:hypothetical protein
MLRHYETIRKVQTILKKELILWIFFIPVVLCPHQSRQTKD